MTTPTPRFTQRPLRLLLATVALSLAAGLAQTAVAQGHGGHGGQGGPEAVAWALTAPAWALVPATRWSGCWTP